MIFDVSETIAIVSEAMTLEPGDVIVMGTPSGVGAARTPPRFLRPGDVCEVEIERVGLLRSPVVEDARPREPSNPDRDPARERSMVMNTERSHDGRDVTAQIRPSPLRIQKLHHHAFRTRDMERTRQFWEDILGMPLVGTFVETVDPVTEQPANYIHTFFELGDGSCLAFFQFQEGTYHDPTYGFQPQDPFDHHVALEVDGLEAVRAYEKRLNAAGIAVMPIDHGYCNSIYFHDPNGMEVEITTRVAKTAEIMDTARQTAHEVLSKWLTGVTEANNRWRTMRGNADLSRH
jgi:catechol 2,3-dioxygenase-like lactoylglutathione lyase family enzyme